MRDFESWNNDPVNVVPPDVARIFEAEERRRDRRTHLLAVAIVLIGSAVTLWALLNL